MTLPVRMTLDRNFVANLDRLSGPSLSFDWRMTGKPLSHTLLLLAVFPAAVNRFQQESSHPQEEALNLAKSSGYSRPWHDGLDAPVKVAFVGDDPAVADMYRLRLQVDGYEVTLFTTAQACPHAGLRAPDIVYLHIGSLNAASLAMHRRLRARPATEHVPILLVSDPLAKKELAFRLKLGIHDFLISSDLVRSEPFWDELNADSQRRGEQALI